MRVFTMQILAIVFSVGLHIPAINKLVTSARIINKNLNSTIYTSIKDDKAEWQTPWLKKYETIVPVISGITLLKGDQIYTKSVRFLAFGISFDVILYEFKTTKGRKLKIRVGGNLISDGEIDEIFKEVRLYKGTCIGTDNCEVFGQINIIRNTFEGYVKMATLGTFHVEKLKSQALVIFRESDILTKRFNPTPQTSGRDFANSENRNGSHEHLKSRTRRAINRRNGTTCYVYIVVDHRFYREYGGKVSETVTEVRHVISEVDLLFRKTDFNQDGSPDNIGIGIAGIDINTSEDDANYLFTTKQERFIENDIESYYNMMKYYDWSEYCLAAIFTHANTGSTLGLAFVPNPIEFGMTIEGGICEKRFYHYLWIREHVGYHSFNIIAVTSNSFGERVPRFVNVGTVAHELGHSFGSPHDPDGICAPEGAGGNYLMYYEATTVQRNNTLKFSLCSLQHIFPVIVKRGWCLEEAAKPRCGDAIVDGEEECDCGDTLSCKTTDPCCTPSDSALHGDMENEPCRYRHTKGESCSPLISACCGADCKPISADEIKECKSKADCSNNAVCDGHSADCPNPSPLPTGTLCDHGRKYCDGSGACDVDICEYRGFLSCDCTHFTSQYCVICCVDINNGTCVPYSTMGVLEGPGLLKPPGSSCYNGLGVCDEMGVCREDKGTDVLVHVESEKGNGNAARNSQVANWLKEYWYYLVVGVILSVLSVIFIIIKLQNTNVLAQKTYQTGRLHQIIGESEILKSKLMYNATQMERLFECKLNSIRKCSNPTTLNGIISRLSTFFPTVPSPTLKKYVRRSTSEDVAVRLLLLRGFPMKPMTISTKECCVQKNSPDSY